MEKRCAEVEKIKFWPSNCPISSEHLWLAPFILLFQVECQLFFYHVNRVALQN